MSRNRVDLPSPLRPMSPVRPAPKVTSSRSRTAVPSGQEKERSVQRTDWSGAAMRSPVRVSMTGIATPAPGGGCQTSELHEPASSRRECDAPTVRGTATEFRLTCCYSSVTWGPSSLGGSSSMKVLDLYERASRVPLGRGAFSLAFGLKAPYFLTIAPTVVELRPNHAAVRVRKWWGVHNHIGTVHVIAVANGLEM